MKAIGVLVLVACGSRPTPPTSLRDPGEPGPIASPASGLVIRETSPLLRFHGPARLQITQECKSTATCAFAMSRIDVEVRAHGYRVEERLHGPGRYYWRTRQRGVWSAVRYFDIGSRDDVNGDGRADVVVVEDRNVFVAYGEAKGLGDRVELAKRGGVARIVGDLDGDFVADVVVGGKDVVYIFRGREPAWTIDTSFSATAVAGSDFNGDGFNELVVGSDNGLVVYAGSANGPLVDAPIAIDPAPVAALGTGDFDGDGYLDLVTGTATFRGSAGGLAARQEVEVPATLRDPQARFGAAIATGDLDGDGFGDAVIAAPGASRVLVLRGSATGLHPVHTIKPEQALGERDWGSAVAAGDIDGDQRPDVLVGVAVQGELPRLAVLRYQWPFTRPLQTASDRSTSTLQLADINGDGFADAIVGSAVFLGSATGLALR